MSSRQTAKPPSSHRRSYSAAYEAVRSSIRYGSASSSDRRREAVRAARAGRRAAFRRSSGDPGAPVLHGPILPCRVVAAVDLRLDAKQRALREEAAAFCAGMRPLLEVDPEWRRQGMLSDGDSRRRQPRARRGGLDRHVLARGARRRGLSRLTATLVEEVLGYHWLPLSSYLLSYKTIGAAIERFGSPALVERLCRRSPRRARLLPGLLGSRSAAATSAR